jgi:ubiquinone/menaquinone biosynthesis C-methylase UbiE
MTTPTPDRQTVQRDQANAAADRSRWAAKAAIQGKAMTDAIVRGCGAKPGMRALDVACGAGEPTLTLAQAVLPGGSVVASDLVPDYLETVQNSARKLGLTNISVQQADAEELPFPDGSFDTITCRLGVMFMSDAEKALSEMRRVLSPGCRASFVVWQTLEKNPFHMCTHGVFSKYLPPRGPGAPSPQRFAEPGTLPDAMRRAGFLQVEEESLELPWPWPGTVEEAWDAAWRRQGSFRNALERIDPALHPQVIQEGHDAVRPYYDGTQVNWVANIHLVTGTR